MKLTNTTVIDKQVIADVSGFIIYRATQQNTGRIIIPPPCNTTRWSLVFSGSPATTIVVGKEHRKRHSPYTGSSHRQADQISIFADFSLIIEKLLSLEIVETLKHPALKKKIDCNIADIIRLFLLYSIDEVRLDSFLFVQQHLINFAPPRCPQTGENSVDNISCLIVHTETMLVIFFEVFRIRVSYLFYLIRTCYLSVQSDYF